MALPAVIAFAVGIGSATAIFTVVNDVLLRPLPYPDGERFVSLSVEYDKSRHAVPAPRGAVAGAIAFILASVGLYGLMPFTFERRSQEAAIPIALGATRGRVLAGARFHTRSVTVSESGSC